MGRIGFPETSLALLGREYGTDRFPRNVSFTVIKMGLVGFPETSLGLLGQEYGTIGFPETSHGLLDPGKGTDRLCRNADNYEFVLLYIAEERRCLHRSGSLKS